MPGRFVLRVAVAKVIESRKNSRRNDMAAAGTNPKIEELRFKLKTDPKSRLFYPLAEELRKVGQFAEAEQVLRAGLTTHATYLSAWVVLGRVLREQAKHAEAVTALSQALELDRGNVVVARLLAESYLAMGEKVEAIKKYKLVAALMPGDEDTEAAIARLQNELGGPSAPAAPPPAAPPAPPAPVSPAPPPVPQVPVTAAPPPAITAPVPAPPSVPVSEPDTEPFDITYSGLKKEQARDFATGDSDPMRADHEESPFEEPAADAGYSADAFSLEEPAGMHLAAPPAAADLAEPFPSEPFAPQGEPLGAPETEEADLYEPAADVAPGFLQGRFDANVPPPPAASDDFAKTITMADLYANQGLIDEARDIYEDVLARDPDNAAVRAKLEALEDMEAAPQPEVEDEWSEPEERHEPAPFGMRPPEDEEPTLELRAPQAAEVRNEVPTPVAPQPAAPAEPEAPKGPGKVEKLESWLSKVKRPGVGSV
jgi:tetratricopeptide (TPR) repeat protein